jgi:hypothetical protein
VASPRKSPAFSPNGSPFRRDGQRLAGRGRKPIDMIDENKGGVGRCTSGAEDQISVQKCRIGTSSQQGQSRETRTRERQKSGDAKLTAHQKRARNIKLPSQEPWNPGRQRNPADRQQLKGDGRVAGCIPRPTTTDIGVDFWKHQLQIAMRCRHPLSALPRFVTDFRGGSKFIPRAHNQGAGG